MGSLSVWAVGRGYREVEISECLRTDPSTPASWLPFLRPSIHLLPPKWLLYLRAFFYAPGGIAATIFVFATIITVSVLTGKNALYLYPYLGGSINFWLGLRIVQRGERCLSAPVIASNHSGVFDMQLITMSYSNIVALAKKETQYIPLIGHVAKIMGCIFVDRGDEADRKKATETINAYVEDSKTGDPVLLVFPEGTTSNHQHILPFKTGVFETDRQLQPVRITYHNPHFSFSLSTNQLVPFATCFALGSGEAVVEWLLPVSRKSNETPEMFAERVRQMIIGDDKFIAGEAGNFRAHKTVTQHVARLRRGTAKNE